ncbi:MAG: hypothetical protein RR234_07135 [Christensenella sp.]
MKKFVASFVLIALCFSLFATTALAAEQSDITPYWTNTISVDPTIDFSGIYSTVIKGVRATSSISATLVLSEKNFWGGYTEVSRTSKTVYSTLATFSGSYAVQSGKTYRLEVTATITAKGLGETVSISCEKKI